MREVEIKVRCDRCWKDDETRVTAETEVKLTIDGETRLLAVCKDHQMIRLEDLLLIFKQYGTPDEDEVTPADRAKRQVKGRPGGAVKRTDVFPTGCPWPGCGYPRPFESATGLGRHMSVVHGVSYLDWSAMSDSERAAAVSKIAREKHPVVRAVV